MTTPLLLVFLITLNFPAPTVNGVKIVTRQITGGFADTRIEYVTADRLRSEWQVMPDRYGPAYPMASIVYEGTKERVFVLDLKAREYVTYETDSHGGTLGSKPKPAGDSGGTLQIWIDYIDTGDRKEIFGYPARHIITRERRVASPGACTGSSVSETDGWYVDASVLPEWRQTKKKPGGVVVASVVFSASNCLNRVDKIDIHHVGTEPGFPVKVNTTLQSEIQDRDRPKTIVSNWGSEVVELRAGPLDSTLFEVPPDFRQVDKLKNLFAPPPPPRRQLSGWDWLKEKVQEIFQ